jgi:serine/threonine protein kinase
MIMEYCTMDLSQYLKQYKLDEARAIDIIRQVINGLNYLVGKGVIHRDIKPANILVNSRNEFKLADFGLARYVQEYDSSLLKTVAGTPLYMAPQILKKIAYTTKCDIWSSGIIFYELLVGKLPWNATSESELIYNITNKSLQIPGHLSEWSKNLLSRMLVILESDRIGWD